MSAALLRRPASPSPRPDLPELLLPPSAAFERTASVRALRVLLRRLSTPPLPPSLSLSLSPPPPPLSLPPSAAAFPAEHVIDLSSDSDSDSDSGSECGCDYAGSHPCDADADAPPPSCLDAPLALVAALWRPALLAAARASQKGAPWPPPVADGRLCLAGCLPFV